MQDMKTLPLPDEGKATPRTLLRLPVVLRMTGLAPGAMPMPIERPTVTH